MITLRRLFGVLLTITSLASCVVDGGSKTDVHEAESIFAAEEALQLPWAFYPAYEGMYTVSYVQNGTFPIVRMTYNCSSFNPCPAKARLGGKLGATVYQQRVLHA